MRIAATGFLACVLLTFQPGVAPLVGEAAAQQKYPDVVAAKVTPRGGDRFDFDVTISSPYDTPKRYADGFRVVGPEGKVYGERKLLHDHADEQPFTRDLYGVTIPAGIGTVTVEARDQSYGYGGRKLKVRVPGR
jgi:hypothetical protein